MRSAAAGLRHCHCSVIVSLSLSLSLSLHPFIPSLSLSLSLSLSFFSFLSFSFHCSLYSCLCLYQVAHLALYGKVLLSTQLYFCICCRAGRIRAGRAAVLQLTSAPRGPGSRGPLALWISARRSAAVRASTPLEVLLVILALTLFPTGLIASLANLFRLCPFRLVLACPATRMSCLSAARSPALCRFPMSRWAFAASSLSMCSWPPGATRFPLKTHAALRLTAAIPAVRCPIRRAQSSSSKLASALHPASSL